MQRYMEKQQAGTASADDVLMLQHELDDAKLDTQETKREVEQARDGDAGFFRKWRNLLRLRRDKSE